MIKVGCCGFPVARTRYYEQLSCIEVQITFYQPPQLKTLEKWRSEAPDGFEFTVKAWQLITHRFGGPTYRRLRTNIPEKKRKYYGSFQPTDEVKAAWQTTRECAKALHAHVIVFQTPPNFGPTGENEGNIRRFFRGLKRGSFVFVWEPRGAWLSEGERIRRICLDLDLVHCSVDPFRYESAAGKIDYPRLHGRVEERRIDYNYRYTRAELERLRGFFRRDDGYCMFNNTAMLEDALAFGEMVSPAEK